MTVKPYPAYTESGIEWIGLVPAEWQQKPFFAAVRERREKNRGLKEDNLLSLSRGNIVRKDMTSNDGLLPESFDTYQIVRPSDVVFRLTDLQNDKRSLRSALVGEQGIITSAYLAVTPVFHDSRYFAFLMRAYDAQKVFYSMGGGLRQSMKFDDMKHLPVMAPTLDEQRQIANYLDTHTARIDTLIGKQEQLIETLAERRQAVISHAVTKGLDPDAPMKESGYEWAGTVPELWSLKRVSWLFRLVGSGTTPPSDDERYYGKGTAWVTTGELREGTITETTKSVTEAATSKFPTLRVYEPGTLLIAMYGATIGRLAVLGVPACTNQACCALSMPVGVRTRFAFYSLLAAKEHILVLAVGGGQPNINQEMLRALRLPTPPISEQDAIVYFLDRETDQIDALSAKAREMIDVLKERRQALISAAVTGKIDVRGLV